MRVLWLTVGVVLGGGCLAFMVFLLTAMLHQMSDMSAVLVQVRDKLGVTNQGISGISSGLGRSGDLYQGIGQIGKGMGELRGDIRAMGGRLGDTNAKLGGMGSTLGEM